MKIRDVLFEDELQQILQEPGNFIWDIQDACMHLGIDLPEDEEGEADEAETASLIWNWANNLRPYVQNGRMTIYRAIDVPDNWVPKSLGVYWSFDPKFALPYDAPGGLEGPHVIIQAVATDNEINWPITIALQEMTEEEVRLYPGFPVQITQITRGGQPALPHLWGKMFPS